MEHIQTERLHLRPLTREEAERMVAGVGEGWAPGFPRQDDKDVAGMYLRAVLPDDELYVPLQMVRRSDGLVIGLLGFFGPPVNGRVEFGYGVAKEVEGQGYTTEAVLALLQTAAATGRVKRACADTTHENVGSQRVMEKAGLRRVSSDEAKHYYEIVYG